MTMTRYRSTVLYPQCGEYLLPLCFSVVSGGSGGGSGGGEREEFLECGWRRVTRWRHSVRVRVSPLTRPVLPCHHQLAPLLPQLAPLLSWASDVINCGIDIFHHLTNIVFQN